MKKVFIIAEIGINHNGDINLAKKMIKSAKECGADAVKFQKRDVKTLYSKEYLLSYRESPWGKTQLDQKNGLEFGLKEYEQIINYCKKLKIDWFASPWDLPSVNFLKKLKPKYMKVPSALIIDPKLLDAIAKIKKFTFISTGMSTFKDIDRAVRIFKKHKCGFELMHCISAYPFEDHQANLNMIEVLRNKYKVNIGYSGHEKGGTAVSYAAVALGATSVERHFTLDRSLYGSDQSASLSPDGFRKLCGGIRVLEKALIGTKKKYILNIEKGVAKKLRENI